MKERPILFSAPMVKAIVSGAKTMTRRIVKPQPQHIQHHVYKGKTLYDAEHRIWWWKQHSFENLIDFDDGRLDLAKLCPYGVGGDRLWVKETFSPRDDPPDGYIYRADVSQYDWRTLEPFEHKEKRWTSPLFMRRSQSRITLDITNVRIERLHEITEEDAKAEGVERDTEPCDHTRLSCEDVGCMGPTHRSSFAELWQQINGRESWDANPFVWVISFRRVEQARSVA